MRLLLTRPEPEIHRTAAALEALGHKVIAAPVMETVFLDPPKAPEPPAGIILTSVNGARALARWPLAGSWHDLPLYAVGDRTAAVARDMGFRDVHAAEGDAVALAALIRRHVRAGAGRLLYVAAEDRAAELDAVLGAEGYDVRLVEAYRMEPVAALPEPVAAALSDGGAEGALFYSRRSAAIFLDLAGRGGLTPRLARLEAFCLSDAVAAPLAGHFARLRVAAAPDEKALFALLPPPG